MTMTVTLITNPLTLGMWAFAWFAPDQQWLSHNSWKLDVTFQETDSMKIIFFHKEEKHKDEDSSVINKLV